MFEEHLERRRRAINDAKADCDDPTCTASVECITTPAAGNEAGVLLTDTSACPSPFGGTQKYNRNLQVPTSCNGCSCNTDGACRVSFFADNSTSYCGAAELTTFASLVWTGSASPYPCATFSVRNPMSIRSTINLEHHNCNGVGAVPTAVSWGTSANSCSVTRTSMTCV